MANVVINFEAPESLKKMAKRKAKKKDLTMSQWLRKIIKESE